MAERDRLNAVLKKLAAGAPMASVSTEGTQSLLTDILRAIDEIVLPRELEFSAGGKALTLSVAKRQVYAASGLVNADLSEADVEELQSPHEKIAVTARQMTVSRSS